MRLTAASRTPARALRRFLHPDGLMRRSTHHI
ncbi:hypothetical protein [Methyloversatilis sp. XJ19-13]